MIYRSSQMSNNSDILMNIVSYAVESRVATVKQHKQGSVHQATMT